MYLRGWICIIFPLGRFTPPPDTEQNKKERVPVFMKSLPGGANYHQEKFISPRETQSLRHSQRIHPWFFVPVFRVLATDLVRHESSGASLECWFIHDRATYTIGTVVSPTVLVSNTEYELAPGTSDFTDYTFPCLSLFLDSSSPWRRLFLRLFGMFLFR